MLHVLGQVEYLPLIFDYHRYRIDWPPVSLIIIFGKRILVLAVLTEVVVELPYFLSKRLRRNEMIDRTYKWRSLRNFFRQDVFDGDPGGRIEDKNFGAKWFWKLAEQHWLDFIVFSPYKDSNLRKKNQGLFNSHRKPKHCQLKHWRKNFGKNYGTFGLAGFQC